MHRRLRDCSLGALLATGLISAGCGGGGGLVPRDPFAYDPSQPLLVQTASTAARGPVQVRSLTYAASDGTRVPALFATPKQTAVVGCLMYQPGVLPKEAAAPIWPLAGRLGLAVFTIDPRDTGARASGSPPLRAGFGSPAGLVSFLRSDVIDLRRGLDYLERQASCHHNVGYMGIRQGATFGVLLAGADPRVRASILLSVGATWRAALFYSPLGQRAIAQHPATALTAAADLAPLNPARWIPRISPRPVMIVDGLADPLIPPISALELAGAAREPKMLVFFTGAVSASIGPPGQGVAAQVVGFLKKNLAGDRPVS